MAEGMYERHLAAASTPQLGPDGDPYEDAESDSEVEVEVEVELGEVELLEHGETIDVGVTASTPGEPPPGEPVDEVLHVHRLEATALSTDELDIAAEREDRERAALEEDEEREASLDEMLRRTLSAGRGLESRVEVLDDQEAVTLEPRGPVRAAEEFVCSRCLLRKHCSQLVDPQRRICRDCA